MNKPVLFYISVTLLSVSQIHAQESQDSENVAKSHWELGGTFTNQTLFNGRKDSVAMPNLTPTLGYYDKSGFYIAASTSFLTTTGKADLIEFSAGYQFTINKFEGEIIAEKNFYNSKSSNVKSEVKGSFTASGAFDFNVIKPSFQAIINFSSVPDYGFNLGLQHYFSFADDKFSIEPGVQMNASTQNYYGGYYNKRRYAKSRKGALQYYDISAQVIDASTFKILDYELSSPFTYRVNKFEFNFTPSYAIPVNPSQVILTIKPSGGSPVSKTFTEKLNNCFFFSMGVNYSF